MLISSLNEIAQNWLQFMGQQVILSTLYFILIFLFSKIIRRGYVWIHLGLWGLIFIKLILPPNFSWQYSTGSYINPRLSQISLTQQQNFSQIVGIDNILKNTDEQYFNTSHEAVEANGLVIPAGRNNARYNANISPTTPIPITKNKQKTDINHVPVLLFAFWLIGVLGLFVLYIFKALAFLRRKKMATEISSSEINALVSRWQNKFNIRRKIDVYSGDTFTTPCTTGLLLPTIYLPDQLVTSFNIEELEPIIAHEMAHIKRCDYLFSQFQNFIQLIYFFHPVVWFANSKLNFLREESCDAMVVAGCQIPAEKYNHSMLKVMESNFHIGDMAPSLNLGFGNPKKKFKERMQNIYRYAQFNRSFRLVYLLPLVIIALLILPVAFIHADFNTQQALHTISGEFPFHNTTFELKILSKSGQKFQGLFKWTPERIPTWQTVEGEYLDADSLVFTSKAFLLTRYYRDGYPLENCLYRLAVKGDSVYGSGNWPQGNYPGNYFRGRFTNESQPLSEIEQDVLKVYNSEIPLLSELDSLLSLWSKAKDYKQVDKIETLRAKIAEVNFKILKKRFELYDKHKMSDDSLAVDRDYSHYIQVYGGILRARYDNERMEKFLVANHPKGSRFYWYVLSNQVEKQAYKELGLDRKNLSFEEYSKLYPKISQKKSEIVRSSIDINDIYPNDLIPFLHQFSFGIDDTSSHRSKFLNLLEEVRLKYAMDEDKALRMHKFDSRLKYGWKTPYLEIGSTAPNFSFIDQNDQERDLASLKGKVVYLLFWDWWTRIEYIHHVKNIEKQLDNKNFVVLSIAIESYEDAMRFRDRLMMPWYPIRPVGQLNADIAHLYRNYVNTGFVISKDGKIRARRYPGYENLKDIIKRYL